MDEDHHHGVGVIITNPEKSMFYLEIKDNRYPIARYRGRFSVFGGGIEPEDKDEKSALARELTQELPDDIAKKILTAARPLGTFGVPARLGDYTITVYEAVIPTIELYRFEEKEIKDGLGILVHRESLPFLKFIWNLESIWDMYLKKRELAPR